MAATLVAGSKVKVIMDNAPGRMRRRTLYSFRYYSAFPSSRLKINMVST